MMATKIVQYGEHRYTHTWKPGPKPLPAELLDRRVNISISPVAHEAGKRQAQELGLSFSEWVEMHCLENAVHTETVYT
jgi:hypothetical protein